MSMGRESGSEPSGATHWQFFRAGDFEQVVLRSGADLLALSQLDKKLWAALSCPVHGLEFDTRTLQLIDSDNDDRIRVPELLDAIQFSARLLKDLDGMVAGNDALPLDLIDDAHEEGQQVMAAAWRLLAVCGKEEALALRVEDVVAAQAELVKLPHNGDGIVPPMVAESDELRAVMEEIIACVGGEPDRSGELGVSRARLEQFFDEAAAYLVWLDEAEHQGDVVLPLGSETAAAYASLQALQEKLDDFFVRCSLAAFDPRAALPLNRAEADYAALAPECLSVDHVAVAAFPLATIEAERDLPLVQGLNPAWAATMAQFRELVVVPLLGARDTLSSHEWQAVQARFAPYATWLAAKRGAAVEGLGEERLGTLLAGDARHRIEDLIGRDLALAPEFASMEKVERLVRYQRDLVPLLRNFVSFADFYGGQRKAIFQAGTLYIDQRSCELCIRVDDIGMHSVLAPLSGTYLIYCDCSRRGGDDKMTIAAAITAGDEGGLMAGRHGLFYDRLGRDWDATVVKVIEQPISIRQAFFAPYRRLARFIEAQLEKIASAKNKAVDASMAGGAEGAANVAQSGKAPPTSFDVAKFAGIFAAIGLALGAIGSVVVALVSGLVALAWWQIPLVFVGVILAISGFSMVLAWLKLRSRNLAPLLDGNGWAVNTRARINIPFGTSLTDLAVLPPGSERSLRDPYSEKRQPWGLYLLLVILLLGGLAYWLSRHH